MSKENENSRQTVLITGATVGIGYELSKIFAANGYDLVLVARNAKLLAERKQELASSAGVRVWWFARDLSAADAAEALYQEVQQAGITVDVLINNAGFGALGTFAELDDRVQLEMIQLNVTALTALFKRFLDEMLLRGSGKIMNVASTAAFQPGPYQAVYYATKAHVLHLTEAVAFELKDRPVTICALCPGPTATEFQERAGFKNVLLMKGYVMSPEAVARAGYAGLMKGKTIIIPGLVNRLLAQSYRFGPRKLIQSVVAWLQKNR